MTSGRLLACCLLFSASVAGQQQTTKLNVAWHPNIETYFIAERLAVERLGRYGYITRETSNAHQPMVSAAFKQFGSYKDSTIGIKTAETLDALRRQHYFNDLIVEVLLYARQFPDTGYRYPLEQMVDYDQKKAALPLVKSLIGELRAFYVNAAVDSFLRANQFFYEGAVKEVKKDIPPAIDRHMEKFYGEKANVFTALVNPTMPIAPVEGDFRGIGPVVRTSEGNLPFMIMSTINMLPPRASLRDYNHFGFDNPGHTRMLTVHEFGHSFVNPHTVPKTAEINRYSYLFTDSLRKVMEAQDIYSWFVCITEHLVRLGEIRIAEQMHDTVQARWLRDLHIKTCKFIFIPALEEKIKVYESNRKKYRTFADFLPELLKVIGAFTPAQVDDLLQKVK